MPNDAHSLEDRGWSIVSANDGVATTDDGPSPDPDPPAPEPDVRGFFRALTPEELRAFGEGEYILSVSEATDKKNWRAALRKASQFNVSKWEAVRRCAKIRAQNERTRARPHAAVTDGGGTVRRRRTPSPDEHTCRRARGQSVLDDPGVRTAVLLGAGALLLVYLLDGGGA